MKVALRSSLGFGFASGVVTTLGLMMGLAFGTHSESVVIGGIITIAIADALSDALGMHISKETGFIRSVKEVWESTFYTFLSKLLTALSFVIPLLLFDLSLAIWVNIAWGAVILIVLSVVIARYHKFNIWHVVLEHLAVASVVVVASYFVGEWISRIFQ